jgi:hypothetical protein
MKYSDFILTRYDADEGKLFDWKEPRYDEVIDEDGEIIQVQAHLYTKTLFIGATDTIENYIEVDESGNVTELAAPEDATEADYVAALAELGVE